MNTEAEYLTIEQLSEHLHISVGTVRNRLSNGDPMPPSCRVGRRQLFPYKELKRWIDERVVSNDVSIEELK